MSLAISFQSPSAGQRGFSLIEVLVALLILSIGLLGLAALQTTSLKYNTDSYFRTQATYFVYDIIDRMRANSTAVSDGGGYDVPTDTAAATVITTYNGCKSSGCACDTSSCSTTNLATYDLGKWFERVTTTLPGAIGSNVPTIDINATKKVTIIIRWQERDLNKSQSWEIQL